METLVKKIDTLKRIAIKEMRTAKDYNDYLVAKQNLKSLDFMSYGALITNDALSIERIDRLYKNCGF